VAALLAVTLIAVVGWLLLKGWSEKRHHAEWTSIRAEIRAFVTETPGYPESAATLDPIVDAVLDRAERDTAIPPRTPKLKDAAKAAAAMAIYEEVAKTKDRGAFEVAERLAERVGLGNPYQKAPPFPATKATTQDAL
jgi:hypothetical protein